ncbi:endonuclease/exonuclease/phosphatase family protein [Shimia sp. R11_0]|uniref:endonuclease/exonuclease/phosphatase family protein n=1 Tax=Shimia sp. R11_0 TaxID=2821096 RepID=UPI001ADC8B79|nr:endonuclease/exonuclease/phosphatase family protein [Shimia sp. R11_0]MBO9477898.1 endonuclease/exonuclease/phosphatase family protein [Shimia sp. R11_0]
MKIVSYNIQYGLGQDGRYDLERIAETVRDADIICLQEVERYWQRSGMVDQVALLGAALPEFHLVYGANVDMDASYRDGAGRLVRRRQQFGNMVLSRYPITTSRNFPLPKRGLIHQHSVQKGLLEAVVDAPGGALRIYCTHLCHLCPETRLPQIERIKEIIGNAVAEGAAWNGAHPDDTAGWIERPAHPMPEAFFLAGDMNCTADSAEYAALVGPYAPGFGRLVTPAGYVDAWVAAGQQEREGDTRSGRKIDHLFCTAPLSEAIQSAWIDTASIGSDHQPLFVQIQPR